MHKKSVSIVLSFLSTILLFNAFLYATSDEFLVNTYTPNWQVAPSIGIDNDGKFVIAWQSFNQDGSFYGIFAQRFDRDGTPIGNEFQVNNYTNKDQEWVTVAVASTSLGNFVITWDSDGQDGSGYGIFAQLYNYSGDPLGYEFQVNTYTEDDQLSPSASMDSEGNFIITWWGKGIEDKFGIFAKRFDKNGTPIGNEFYVNTSITYGNQFYPYVAMSNTGSFIITWWGTGYADFSGVYARRYDNVGNPLGSEFLVNTYTNDVQRAPAVDIAEDGSFIITWISYGQDGSGSGIYAQRYDNIGNTLGSEFQVNTYSDNDQGGPWGANPPGVSMNNDGYIITWSSDGQDGSGWGVYAKKYDYNDKPIDEEFRVNLYTDNNQWYPAIAMSSEGLYVITWHSFNQYSSNSAYDIYAKINPTWSQQTPPPDAITLESFSAHPENSNINLSWSTGTEMDNLGFYIVRSESTDNGFMLLNEEIILAKGDAYSGYSYSYIDTHVNPGHVYYYWLADLDIHGEYTIHGPVKVVTNILK